MFSSICGISNRRSARIEQDVSSLKKDFTILNATVCSLHAKIDEMTRIYQLDMTLIDEGELIQNSSCIEGARVESEL